MRRRQLMIDTKFSDSDDDLREVLNLHEHYVDEERYNSLCQFCIVLLRVQEKAKLNAFEKIRKVSEEFGRNMQYRYSKMFEMEKIYRNQEFEKLKFRSRSQNVEGKKIKHPQTFVPNLKFQKQPKQSGKNILSKLNNLQKLLKKMKKETQISNRASICYPKEYQYPRHNSERYLISYPMTQSHYHVIHRQEPPPSNYMHQQQLPNRSIYRPYQLEQIPNPYRSQRLRTQQTVQSKAQSIDISEQLKEIKKQMKQLIQLNMEVIYRNALPSESQFQYNSRHQMVSPKVTLKEKETQPTYRSYQQTLNFQVEDFSKKQPEHLNYVSANTKKVPYKRYNTGASYD